MQNISLLNFEQAAGFAPFTRGYKEFDFCTKVELLHKVNSFNFKLNSSSNEALYTLFKTIVTAPNAAKELHLLIDLPINLNYIYLTATLRTLLSLINEVKTGNSASSKFLFYAKNNSAEAIYLNYIYCEASQIDYLLTKAHAISILQNIPKNPVPIDPFFGNLDLEKKTNELVTSLWTEIYKLL